MLAWAHIFHGGGANQTFTMSAGPMFNIFMFCESYSKILIFPFEDMCRSQQAPCIFCLLVYVINY